MIIEKQVVEGSRYDVNLNDYVAEGELTVTITLGEYRNLIKECVENKQRKEHESWLDQYNRANKAEERVKELEIEVSNLYKRLTAENDNADSGGTDND